MSYPEFTLFARISVARFRSDGRRAQEASASRFWQRGRRSNGFLPACVCVLAGVLAFPCQIRGALFSLETWIVAGDALRCILRCTGSRRSKQLASRFLASIKSFKRARFVPFGERCTRICDFCPMCAQLFVASSKEFVRHGGSQARSANPIPFPHAGRHHQIPADHGERDRVMQFHQPSLFASAAVKGMFGVGRPRS